MFNGVIMMNCAECCECGAILVSNDTDRFEECSCGNLRITGGTMVLYRVIKHEDGEYREQSYKYKDVIKMEVRKWNGVEELKVFSYGTK